MKDAAPDRERRFSYGLGAGARTTRASNQQVVVSEVRVFR